MLGLLVDLETLKKIKEPQLSIPGLYEISPYSFQKIAAIASVEVCPRLLIGDGVGMGKTLEALCSVQMLHNLNQLSLNDTLVICPGAAKDQWKDHFKKYTALSALVVETTEDPLKYLKKRFNILIMSFSTLRTHVEVLKEHPFKFIICDEGLFKNSLGQTFMALQTLTRKAPRLLILNANAVENDLLELYSHIELIKPGFISKQDFQNRYCTTEIRWYRTKYGTLKSDEKVVGPKSLETLQELKNLMKDFYLARSPDDAGISEQLPKVILKYIYVELKKSQKEAYLNELKLFKERKIKPATLLPNLLRICHGKKENWKNEEHPETFSSKAEAIINLVNSFGKEPFVLYSTFNDPLLSMAKIFTARGRKAGFFTGLQKEADRQRHLKEFKEGKRDALFINNAAQRALNIETCRYLICLNELYNPQSRNQLHGRIRRLSSTFSNVFVYSFVTKNTVEERILELQDKKEELAKYINTDGEVPEDLTDEQLEKLLGTRKSLINKESLKLTKEIFESELT